jgi:putative two-component system response regulator
MVITHEPALRPVARLLDALHCGAALIDRAGRIVHLNERLGAMLRRSPDELIGRALHEIYTTPEGRRRVDDVLEHFDEAREAEFFLPLPDGGALPVIVSGRLLEDEPPLSAYRVVTFSDISAMKTVEERSRRHFEEIVRLSDTVIEQALALKRYNADLEQRVRERTAELHEANLEAIYMLAVAGETKDVDTGAHVRRIQRYTERLARAIGLPSAEAEHVGHSAILHDVGKILVPDHILQKPGPLTAEERALMELHTVTGENIISRKPFFEVARQIARSHHENWDGSGYPDRLSGDRIPPAARLVHLADVFDALTSPRVYKEAWSLDRALAELNADQRRQFDPALVRALRELVRAGEWAVLST